MKIFMFLFLVGYAVRCDEPNYYVVQMPDTIQRDPMPKSREFNVYWNVPTMQCKSKKIYFDDLYEKYGIIQNTGDTFRGDKISILYDPGEFPALFKNTTSGEIKYRNGGVPQEGDLIKHLESFQEFVEDSIPDRNFSGIAIIDFESWRPIFRQNFGSLIPYKTISIEIERKRHWWWKKEWIEAEATRRFEEAGRDFMQATISLAKKLRPQALWGYYAFPYCFNMGAKKHEYCADGVNQENNRIKWLWKESSALYPSVYSSSELSSSELIMLIRGRVTEAQRVNVGNVPVLPYFWYRYRDSDFLKQTDLEVAIKTFYKGNTSGFIIWGSSNDVNTVKKCQGLRQYVDKILGPAVAKYTKYTKYSDEMDTETNENNINATNNNDVLSNETAQEQNIDEKDSILIDLILHKIASDCIDGCYNDTNKNIKQDVINENPVLLTTEDPFKKSSSEKATEPTSSTQKANIIENDDLYYYDLTIDDEIAEDSIFNIKSTETSTTNVNNAISNLSISDNAVENSSNNSLNNPTSPISLNPDESISIGINSINYINEYTTSPTRNLNTERNRNIDESSLTTNLYDNSTEIYVVTEGNSTEISSLITEEKLIDTNSVINIVFGTSTIHNLNKDLSTTTLNPEDSSQESEQSSTSNLENSSTNPTFTYVKKNESNRDSVDFKETETTAFNQSSEYSTDTTPNLSIDSATEANSMNLSDNLATQDINTVNNTINSDIDTEQYRNISYTTENVDLISRVLPGEEFIVISTNTETSITTNTNTEHSIDTSEKSYTTSIATEESITNNINEKETTKTEEYLTVEANKIYLNTEDTSTEKYISESTEHYNKEIYKRLHLTTNALGTEDEKELLLSTSDFSETVFSTTEPDEIVVSSTKDTEALTTILVPDLSNQVVVSVF